MATDVERVKFSLREYRSLSIPDDDGDATVRARHPLAIQLSYNTMISSQADAENFGAYMMNLRSGERTSWQTLISKINYPNLEIGDTITIFFSRFGLETGKNFIVKRLKRDSESLYYEVNLFGPE